MDIIVFLCSAWPADNFWANIIKVFDVGSYAWTIILFTLILKLVLTPLDFFQRYYTNKTTRAQAKLKPQLEKLQRQYGQNQNLLAKKQNELYQKSGFSMKGSCIVMLVYMVVTLLVFITLYNSIQYIAGFKIKNQFNQLNQTYTVSYNADYYNYLNVDQDYLDSLTTEEEKSQYLEARILAKKTEIGQELGTTETEQIDNKFQDDCLAFSSTAQDKVVEKYKEIKDDWLWIKNIWIADSATSKEILTYNSYINATKDTVSKEQYEVVMYKLINGNSDINGVNGYFILSVLVVLVSFLTQFISKKLSTPKGMEKQTNQGGMAKIMMFVMPLIMLTFTLNSSAIFAIYILANSLISTLLMPITTVLCNKIFDRQEQKHFEETKVDYRRY